MLTRRMIHDDAAAVRALHARCSPESLRLRYLGPHPRISDRVIRLFTNPARGTSLVTVDGGTVIAMTNVMNTGEPGVVEVAMLVDDPWQGRGLGRALLDHAIALATTSGARELTASMYGTNRKMVRLMKAAGAVLPAAFSQVIEVRLPLSAAGAPCR